MTLVDRTNESIPLSLEGPVLLRWDGNGNEEVSTPAALDIDADFDSSETPKEWIWFMFYANDQEPWFKLTYEEAEKVYDRLGRCLGKVTNDE